MVLFVRLLQFIRFICSKIFHNLLHETKKSEKEIRFSVKEGNVKHQSTHIRAEATVEI